MVNVAQNATQPIFHTLTGLILMTNSKEATEVCFNYQYKYAI